MGGKNYSIPGFEDIQGVSRRGGGGVCYRGQSTDNPYWFRDFDESLSCILLNDTAGFQPIEISKPPEDFLFMF